MAPESMFPPGTPVCVVETMMRRHEPITKETIGVVEAWENRATGSWYARQKDDRLWLKRLRLRKVDGELTLLVIDENTAILGC